MNYEKTTVNPKEIEISKPGREGEKLRPNLPKPSPKPNPKK